MNRSFCKFRYITANTLGWRRKMKPRRPWDRRGSEKRTANASDSSRVMGLSLCEDQFSTPREPQAIGVLTVQDQDFALIEKELLGTNRTWRACGWRLVPG